MTLFQFNSVFLVSYLHQHEREDLQDHVKVWSRVGFVLPSLDEERPAGVDRQGEEGEEHAEQLDIGDPPG